MLCTIVICSQIYTRTLPNLESSIQICCDAKVMLTVNLWVEKELMNGAFGKIRNLIFESSMNPPNMPVAIVIEMGSNYTGSSLPGLPARHIT